MLFLNISESQVTFINRFMQNIKDMDGVHVAIFAVLLYFILLPIWASLVRAFQLKAVEARGAIVLLTVLFASAFVALKYFGNDYKSPLQVKDSILAHFQVQLIRHQLLSDLSRETRMCEADIKEAIKRYPNELYLTKEGGDGIVIQVNYARDSVVVAFKDENILRNLDPENDANSGTKQVRQQDLVEAIEGEIGTEPSEEAIEEFVRRNKVEIYFDTEIEDFINSNRR